MLKKNKNLWVDISWLVYDYYFLDNFPDRYADNNTMEDWVKVIEKHPDRFILGSDKVGHWKDYEKEIFKYYVLLDKLKPETAARVCRENILNVMKKNGGTE